MKYFYWVHTFIAKTLDVRIRGGHSDKEILNNVFQIKTRENWKLTYKEPQNCKTLFGNHQSTDVLAAFTEGPGVKQWRYSEHSLEEGYTQIAEA